MKIMNKPFNVSYVAIVRHGEIVFFAEFVRPDSVETWNEPILVPHLTLLDQHFGSAKKKRVKQQQKYTHGVNTASAV